MEPPEQPSGGNQQQAKMRAQVWNLIIATGYGSLANDSIVSRIMEMLTDGTLQTEEQLAALLGTKAPDQTDCDNTSVNDVCAESHNHPIDCTEDDLSPDDKASRQEQEMGFNSRQFGQRVSCNQNNDNGTNWKLENELTKERSRLKNEDNPEDFRDERISQINVVRSNGETEESYRINQALIDENALDQIEGNTSTRNVGELESNVSGEDQIHIQLQTFECQKEVKTLNIGGTVIESSRDTNDQFGVETSRHKGRQTEVKAHEHDKESMDLDNCNIVKVPREVGALYKCQTEVENSEGDADQFEMDASGFTETVFETQTSEHAMDEAEMESLEDSRGETMLDNSGYMKYQEVEVCRKNNGELLVNTIVVDKRQTESVEDSHQDNCAKRNDFVHCSGQNEKRASLKNGNSGSDSNKDDSYTEASSHKNGVGEGKSQICHVKNIKSSLHTIKSSDNGDIKENGIHNPGHENEENHFHENNPIAVKSRPNAEVNSHDSGGVHVKDFTYNNKTEESSHVNEGQMDENLCNRKENCGERAGQKEWKMVEESQDQMESSIVSEGHLSEKTITYNKSQTEREISSPTKCPLKLSTNVHVSDRLEIVTSGCSGDQRKIQINKHDITQMDIGTIDLGKCQMKGLKEVQTPVEDKEFETKTLEVPIDPFVDRSGEDRGAKAANSSGYIKYQIGKEISESNKYMEVEVLENSCPIVVEKSGLDTKQMRSKTSVYSKDCIDENSHSGNYRKVDRFKYRSEEKKGRAALKAVKKGSLYQHSDNCIESSRCEISPSKEKFGNFDDKHIEGYLYPTRDMDDNDRPGCLISANYIGDKPFTDSSISTVPKRRSPMMTKTKSCSEYRTYYHCSVCDKIFNFRAELVKHKESHERSLATNGISVDKADRVELVKGGKTQMVCKEESQTDVNFSVKTKTHSCNVCGREFRFLSQLFIHERYHKKTNETEYCARRKAVRNDDSAMSPSNSKDFCRDSQLVKPSISTRSVNHGEDRSLSKTCRSVTRESPHKKKGPYPCKGCSRIFQYRSDLLRHEGSHRRVKWQKCSSCGKKFKDTDSLKTHFESVHNSGLQKQPSKCEGNRQPALGVKRKKRNQRKQHQCSVCDTVFKYFYLLIKHQSTHLEKQSPCLKSYKDSTVSRGLERNINADGDKKLPILENAISSRDGESIEKNDGYQCSSCAKIFQSFSSLLRHENLHKVAKPYPCSKCGHSFTDIDSLKTHMDNLHVVVKEKPNSTLDIASNDERSQKISEDIVAETGVEVENWNFNECRGGSQEISQSLDENGGSSECFSQHPSRNDWSKKRSRPQKSFQSSAARDGSGVVDGATVKPYQCLECAEVFSSHTELTEHQAKWDSLQGPFKCTVCQKSFQKKSFFHVHLKIHTRYSPYKCDTCGRCFANSTNVRLHQIVHTGEKPFKCDLCGKNFPLVRALREHKQRHSGVKNYQCSVCDKKFVSRQNLKYHLNAHKLEKPFKCEKCEKCFSVKRNLRRHQIVHSEVILKPHVCSTCGKCFRVKGSLTSHLRKHTGERPFKCSQCGQGFTFSSHLHIHLRKHKGELPFKCAKCGKGFADHSHLKRHYNTHLGIKPHKCSVCGKSFQERFLLKGHMATHSDEMPYKCSTCGKMFRSKAGHRRHEIRHKDGVPSYPCTICHKVYNSKANFKFHMEKHLGQEKHKCSICGKAFLFKKALDNHSNKHKGKKPRKCST